MKKKSITITVITSLVIMMIFSLVLTGTYSLYTGEVSSNNKNQFTTGKLSITANHKSSTISINNSLPMSDYDGMLTTPYTFTITNTGNLDYKFNVKLVPTSYNSYSSQYIKISIDGGNANTLQNLNNIIKSNIILKAGETIDINIRIWLDEYTPNTEIGKTFESRIDIDGQNIGSETIPGPGPNPDPNPNPNPPIDTNNVVSFINNLYLNGNKKQQTVGEISYNYATSINLMNDRLGGKVGLDDGNIRYTGKNPNNYIDLGDSNNLYRIIGVFKNVKIDDYNTKDLIKVVKDTSIGSLPWDNSHAPNGSNSWTHSSIEKLLNPSSSINDQYISSTIRNKIQTVIWNLGGGIDNSIAPFFSDKIYELERGTSKISNPSDGLERSITWKGNVGLIYPSDYGYASTCKLEPYNYENSSCTSTNWLYKEDIKKNMWTITSTVNPSYPSESSVWQISYNGYLNGYGAYASSESEIFPTFYLKDNLNIISGSGTNFDPYIVN